MDDEVFKMVNIEGQVGFRRAGFMVFGLVCVCLVFGLVFGFWFVFGRGMFLLVCFKQQQEAEVPCSQLAKKFRIRGRKKIQGWGEKKKSSKKHRSVNT